MSCTLHNETGDHKWCFVNPEHPEISPALAHSKCQHPALLMTLIHSVINSLHSPSCLSKDDHSPPQPPSMAACSLTASNMPQQLFKEASLCSQPHFATSSAYRTVKIKPDWHFPVQPVSLWCWTYLPLFLQQDDRGGVLVIQGLDAAGHSHLGGFAARAEVAVCTLWPLSDGLTEVIRGDQIAGRWY